MHRTLVQLRHLARRAKLVEEVAMKRRQLSSKPKGNMFQHQESLPRLPVPPMERTLQKYLAAIRPLVSEEDFRKTEKIVEEFKKSPGPKLQAILEQRAKDRTNWLSDWWRDLAYLKQRVSLVINSSAGASFPRQSFRDQDDRLRYASNLVVAALGFKKMIDEETLPVDMLGGKPLCMEQYKYFLGGCRFPGVEIDSHASHRNTRHIAVMRNNKMFALDVYGEDDQPLSTSQLTRQLKTIEEMAGGPGPGIGAFTMMDRKSWAKVYAELIKDERNQTSLKELEKSLFSVCLDGPNPPASSTHERNVQGLHQMLHGGGSGLHSGNRWFDKTLQFVVGDDGTSGFVFEHTPAEGPPVAAIAEHMLTHCHSNPSPGEDARGITEPRSLPLYLSNHLLKVLEQAKLETDKNVGDADVKVMYYNKYGRDLPKSLKFSPDAFIQMAIQLTYFKIHGAPCATYESGSLRLYKLGRTDTIRTCSVDSHNFTKAMQDAAVSREVKAELLKKAIDTHRQYANEVVKGQGIDRHMLGWRLAAMESGDAVPEFHKDPSYATSMHFNISSSQVPTKHDIIMGFGAVVPDGYGVFYNPHKTIIQFTISSFFSHPKTDSKRFGQILAESLDDMKSLYDTPTSKL